MVINEERAAEIAAALLQIKAIKLSPQSPFTWASGLRSPIYCDNRSTLSYPEVRALICRSFCVEIRERFPEAELIAGVATGAIAHGMLVAEELGLPFVYVRSKAKEHGLGRLVEGRLQSGQKTVVIEDLISTGGSSLKAVEGLRAEGAEVLGLLAIFSYGFPAADEAYRRAELQQLTLSDFSHLLPLAKAAGYISESEERELADWNRDNRAWSESFVAASGQ